MLCLERRKDLNFVEFFFLDEFSMENKKLGFLLSSLMCQGLIFVLFLVNIAIFV